MAFIPDEDQQFLRDQFSEVLRQDVKLLLFTKRPSALFIPGAPQEDASYFQQTQELMEEVASLSDKISLDIYDQAKDQVAAQEHSIDKIPAVVLESGGRSLRFFGVPAGYEFSTFVQDIFDISTDNIELAEDTQEYLRNLDHDLHIQVFVTPT